MTKQLYSLELTDNSKTGWAFSLSRRKSCVNSTKICRRLCYGNGIRYCSDTQKQKRLRNFNTCEFLLANGGPELLAENLIALVDQARPADWLTAQISGEPTSVPFSLRLNDIGDHYSTHYARAWLLTVQQRPQCKFWYYTRSFFEPQLLEVLSELASQTNCQGFLSLDSENFEQGLQAYARYPGIWKIALLQQEQSELSAELLPALKDQVRRGQIINFPYHRAGYHVMPVKAQLLTHCPQITTDAYPLQRSRSVLKPCQACALCLPG
jgi:hypothetical protein